MFCFKCGKQIEDGSKFCQYCGAVQDNGNMSDTRYNSTGNEKQRHGFVDEVVNNKPAWYAGLSALDIGILVIYAVLILRWTVTFLKGIKYCWSTFSYLGIGGKLIGMLLYIVPYAFFLCLMVLGIQSVRKHRYNFSTGVITALLGLLMKIGTLFFRNISYGSYAIIGWRIFDIYGAIGIFTIVLGILAGILLYAKTDH